jgi:GNAT superfamily N-acetyltransferase/RimJ/RimL family protein N-acetyltransferase
VQIERFDPATASEARLRECLELVNSGQAVDDPNVPPVSFRRFRGWWTRGFADIPQQIWLASDSGGALLGCYLLQTPDRDNKTNSFLDLFVAPAARRQGLGVALLMHAAGQAKQAGRTLMMAGARVGSAGTDFAEAIGAKCEMEEIRRVLDIGPELPARLAALRAEAEPHAAGYSIRRWVGLTPDDIIDSIAALNNAMADAPHGENEEPMDWDADRVRREDERAIEDGIPCYSVAAIEDATGEAAALTQVYVDPDVPGWAWQGLTAVVRAHRGHRLGMLVKIANLEWLAEAEPQTRYSVTFNAAPNQYMIAVNEKLGHRVSDTFRSYELAVDAATKLGARVGGAAELGR